MRGRARGRSAPDAPDHRDQHAERDRFIQLGQYDAIGPERREGLRLPKQDSLGRGGFSHPQANPVAGFGNHPPLCPPTWGPGNAAPVPGSATTTFRRGDANGDGTYDLADAIHTLGVLFGGGSFDTCEMAADANDDSQVDLGDAVFSLTHFFGDGPGPALGCGIDDTPDSLTCDEYGACM